MTKIFDGKGIVTNENHSNTAGNHRAHFVHTLALKERITNAQRLVNYQNIRLNEGINRKGKPRKHARRISFDRLADEFSDVRKGNYLVNFAVHDFA